MSRQSFVAADISDFPPSSHTAVASTTTRTNLWNPALWTAIGAYDPKPGKVYLLRAGGSYGTTGTPTMLVTPTFGQSSTPGSNISLGSSGTATLTTATGVNWYAEFTLGFRSIGIAASGATCTGSGFIAFGGASGAAAIVLPIGGTIVTTADHTTAQGLCLDVTWGASSASNTITANWTLLQSLN